MVFLQGASIEPVVKSVPEIIKQASQSQLGILALLIIVLFGLAIYFFRKSSIAWRAIIFFAFFGGVIAYAMEITRVASKPESAHYVGRVLDKLSGEPIRKASVIVSLQNKPTPPYFTDSVGAFSFWLARKNVTDDALLQVEHAEYGDYERVLPSDVSAQLGDIKLLPLAASGGASNPATPTSATAPLSPASDASGSSGESDVPKLQPPTANARTSVVVRLPAPLPPSASIQMANAAARTPQVVDVASQPQLSGKGKEWSGWYAVQAGAAPAGYVVEKTEFWLTGDRSCGAWAECREARKDDSQVVWEFRLQGHDEWGAPPQTYSEGHLRVTYRPK